MRLFLSRESLCLLLPVVIGAGFCVEGVVAGPAAEVSEDVYRTDLIACPGPYGFGLGHSGIILVSDKNLLALSDPNKVIDLSTTHHKRLASLRQICERAQAAGHRTLTIAFDYFFQQYRPGTEPPRQWMPDTDRYIELMGAISQFAQRYGLRMQLSFLSPLEIGKGFREATGQSGTWMHYRKGYRDPRSGAYSVQLWRQEQWTNNKGRVSLEDGGVRVFAFREQPIGGTIYRVVEPSRITEITETANVQAYGRMTADSNEIWAGQAITQAAGYDAERIRVYGRGRTDIGRLDRVLVVQMYRTPEMDYFSDVAKGFLHALVDKYVDAGIELNALYSDEMHIQQDWSYFGHHDNGEFAVRYVSDGLRRQFAAEYGQEYLDFAKYLVYFVYGQEDTSNNVDAKTGVMHVFGPTAEDIHRTSLFRSRYYRFLQDGVVDLFADAKAYAEKQMGRKLAARAHATWAESPTVDKWQCGTESEHMYRYEYTSNFIWSNTVHQAASACYDYFKWGDFLTGNGTDHPEGGWLDRDYYALALASSIGILNDVPYAYCAHWGMPGQISALRNNVRDAYGAGASPLPAMVEEMEHRDVEVLMLYPLDLVAAEERFGSWMTQYGYANYVTQSKLLERGQVRDGAIEMAGRRFTTLVTLFEPFPSQKLLSMMRSLAQQGGRVVWSGPPPVLSRSGEAVGTKWGKLFGVDYAPGHSDGLRAPGQQVEFAGPLMSVPDQVILTDFLVDRIYPVTPRAGVEVAARVKDRVVGTSRATAGGGKLVFLGFRPRDDQAGSLGYESRNWFEILLALGAYPPTGVFPGVNDNPEYISRTSDYLTCRFPNGAVAVARHLRDLPETWPGGFARDRSRDEQYLRAHTLPSSLVHLEDFYVDGHRLSYDGQGAVVFRLDSQGRLIGFAGAGSKAVTIDGRQWVLAEGNIGRFAFAPVAQCRRVDGGAVMMCIGYGGGTLRVPAGHLEGQVELVAEGPRPGSRGQPVSYKRSGQVLEIALKPGISGRWIYAVPVEE